jgi:hypothetical protein
LDRISSIACIKIGCIWSRSRDLSSNENVVGQACLFPEIRSVWLVGDDEGREADSECQKRQLV